MGHLLMGLRYVVKNSFIHVVDDEDESVLLRPRAVSEFTGTRMVKEEEFHCSFPPRTEEEDTSASHATSGDDLMSPVPDLDNRTTVMMRNIPNAYTSSSFVELFDANGFWGCYDFVYLPIDFRTGVNLGYAFINFVCHRDADSFIAHFHGFHHWFCQSPKVCEVTWTDPHQGLQEHVERYRNSPVMHEDVSDVYKPRLYLGGKRIPFPAPTKRIRPPRVRPQRPQKLAVR